ncbi:hypothetical protein [Humisphaera borealis]|uniref:Uncharacterized protein n=1 Tax=Humisphaera borealis TaxID=2807512 RepID=A0A7M2X3H1_9BACT|nr:hypothetical protein [Humisphaera borealis]QOV92225.1 hypothetical protein IPV69_13060 [Humisphaera borealis]
MNDSLFGRTPQFDPLDNRRTEYIMLQRPLQRVLGFRGRSIDDVVNSQLVKNEVRLYWKFHKQIIRLSEISELEKQWNGVRL